MLYPTAIGLVLLVLGLALTRGPRVGLWAGMSLAMLVPTWVNIEFRAIEFTFLTIVSLAAIACFLTMPFSKSIRRWLWCDTLMLLLVGSQLLTFIETDGLTPSSFTLPFLGWLLPYAMGRFAIASRDDLDRMTKWLAVPILAIFALTAFESLAHLNLPSAYFGRHTADIRRYGLSRAFGPTGHPIYLGMMMALLMPWAIWGARLARLGTAPRWFVMLPICCALGVLSSVSRGPALVVIGSLGCIAFFHFHRRRVMIASVTLAMGLMMSIGADLVLEGFRAFEHQGKAERQKMVLVDGEEIEYDGTLHRILLFKVYDDAMIRGGMLGHGLIGGQSNLSLVEGKVSAVLQSIDNHYIIYTLRYGFLGVGLFLLIALCGSIYAAQAALDPTRPTQRFVAAQFGSIAMVSLLLFTVWFPIDFRFIWFFSLGCISAWRAHRIGQEAPSVSWQPAQVRDVPVRRLVPGHPTVGQETTATDGKRH
jgi:hypothetical protein